MKRRNRAKVTMEVEELGLDTDRVLLHLDGFLDNEHDKGADDSWGVDFAESIRSKVVKHEGLTLGELEFVDYVEEVWGEEDDQD